MSKQAVSNVSYPVAPGTTVLLSIDCQVGFGAGSWEQVPHADAAVENFRTASRAWRECGGAVVHVQTVYTPERGPSGRITDFEPGVADALAEGTRAAEAYPDLVWTATWSCTRRRSRPCFPATWSISCASGISTPWWSAA